MDLIKLSSEVEGTGDWPGVEIGCDRAFDTLKTQVQNAMRAMSSDRITFTVSVNAVLSPEWRDEPRTDADPLSPVLTTGAVS